MKLDIYNGVEALIFDVDGTLADSMPVHLEAWQETGKKYGFTYTKEVLDRYAGKAGQSIVQIINEQQGLNLDPDEVAEAKEQAFLENLEMVKPVKPVVALLNKYYGRLPIGAGTGGFRHVALKTLSYLGLHNKIQVLVSADDVENHKPAPDTFLKAAKALRVPPEKCLVLEDAELGFQAATNAGMHYIDVKPFYQNT